MIASENCLAPVILLVGPFLYSVRVLRSYSAMHIDNVWQTSLYRALSGCYSWLQRPEDVANNELACTVQHTYSTYS